MQQSILNAVGNLITSLPGISGVYSVYSDMASKQSSEPYIVYRATSDVPFKTFTEEFQHLFLTVEVYAKLGVGSALPRSIANVIYNGLNHVYVSVSGTDDVGFCCHSKGIISAENDYYVHRMDDVEVLSRES